MHKSEETDGLFNEDVSLDKECNLCKEVKYAVGEKTGYGVIIHKMGELKNGWFATLSPKTGGDPKLDFTVQLMPFSHLTHFSQVGSYPGLAENYGITFSKICRAMTTIMMHDQKLKAISEERRLAVSIGTYGKCTTWKEKKEHLHIKIYPFRGNIGQPSTVDSSFGRKDVFKDEKTGEEFIKMVPVKKVNIGEERFDKLAKLFISLLEN